MNSKKIISLLLVFVLIVGMFAGCSKNSDENNDATTTPPTTNIGNETQTTPSNEGTVTVADLKAKYGESDAGKLLPLYNLDPNEPLAISMKYTPTDERAVFSIHTDEKCLPESEVLLFWDYSSYSSTGPKTYNVRPIMGPLTYDRNTEGYWGNVSTYYIKFNYDISAETETKLDTPVIVPMSIKSPTEIPNTHYKIEDGNFILTWDAVPGATSYRIYNCSKVELLETSNKQPNGKEYAYSGNLPRLVAEVDANTLQYRDWLSGWGDNSKDGMIKTPDNDTIGGYRISYQNQNVNGEYYVTAVVNGKESLFSIGVNTCNMALPQEFAKNSSISSNTYETTDDLPKTVNVLYVDGTVVAHPVSYQAKNGTTAVTYKVQGTSLVGCVYVKMGEQDLTVDTNVADDNNGFITVDNQIPQHAPTDVPTINNNKQEDEKPPVQTEPTTPVEPTTPETPTTPTEPSNPSDDTDKQDETIVDLQIENTKEVLEDANKEPVKINDGFTVTASSAAEEYLALKLIAGDSEISLAAFPELQNWAILTDILQEVVYQNPLILGVRQYSYDYKTMILGVKYDYAVDEMAQKQQEIITEGKRVIESIITDNMTSAEKRRAIYDYLVENTEYDDAALESAQNSNFSGADNTYRDAFSTYGILVKKIGVCQSYAMTYDYLCGLVDVDCIVVTGSIYGYLPHAWNKVKIDNEWFITDVTNNEKSTGVKDFMYENPDSVAIAFCYFEDDSYYTDDESGIYVSTSLQYSKYKDCVLDTKAALTDYVKKHAKADTTLEFLATYDEFSSDDVKEALREASVKRIGNSIVIGGYVCVEIVE